MIDGGLIVLIFKLHSRLYAKNTLHKQKKGAKHPRPETRTTTRPGDGMESCDSE